MRGKEYCKVEKKWCKFLNHNICNKANCELCHVNRCPRLVEIETVRFSDILKDVTFDKAFDRLCFWYPDQKSSEKGYKEVFNKLLLMTPHKHNLTDLFINVYLVEENGKDYIDVDGIDMINKNHIRYGIEFEPWIDWVSMFITQSSLDTFTKEDIVGACLYEMTFFGFTENNVQNEKQKLIDSVNECKEQLKNNKK